MKEPSEIDYANVAEALVAVPDVRGRYEEERCLWGDEKPGPHIIFGDVLTPYLIDLLNSSARKGNCGRSLSSLNSWRTTLTSTFKSSLPSRSASAWETVGST